MHIYVCISVFTVSGFAEQYNGDIARISAKLSELQLLLYATSSGNIARIPALLICMRNTVLPQFCDNIARNSCGNIAAILQQYIARRLLRFKCCLLITNYGLILEPGRTIDILQYIRLQTNVVASGLLLPCFHWM